ncbi:MAG: hypothetical protein EHM12_07295 [Dehalococcoidia bacterium]|nr:MAG: hypothetical protein EHM12_07295 [Dehalococcoidia bacterium]
MTAAQKPSLNTDPTAQAKIDAALAEHLDELSAIANEIGAEGIWLIHGVKKAQLIYTPAPGVVMPDMPGVNINLDLNLSLTGAGVLVVMRFPAGAGRKAGLEKR